MNFILPDRDYNRATLLLERVHVLTGAVVADLPACQAAVLAAAAEEATAEAERILRGAKAEGMPESRVADHAVHGRALHRYDLPEGRSKTIGDLLDEQKRRARDLNDQ